MNRTDRRRLGLAWGLSVALAALAGALSVWMLAPQAPGGALSTAVGVGAALATLLALALALRSLRRLAPSADTALAPTGEDRGTAPVDGSTAASASADTRPVVWSETLDPEATAAAPAAAAPARAAFDDDGAIDVDPVGVGPRGGESSASTGPTEPAATPGRAASAGRSDGGRADAAAKVQPDALRRALEAGEMRLFYQPIFDLGARQVHAVEALLRWPRAAKALLPTEDIVAIADHGGFGADLCRFVLATAGQQVVRWHQVLGAAAPGRVCINLSRRQCLDEALIDDFTQVLDTLGLRAEVFQFAVAERDVAAAADVEIRLRALRALGAAVALDRFGAANSSLAALQRLPVDTVKFDRRMIARAEADATVRLVLESTLGLAAELGLEVVVEGVETAQQLALLRSLGCRLAQGHALCPPTDPFALTRRLRGGHWLTEAVRGVPASTASGG